MPAPSLSVKVCPFCMVDARTDASCCAYCGSSYERVAPASVHGSDVTHTRRRTYDGTAHLSGDHEAVFASLDAC